MERINNNSGSVLLYALLVISLITAIAITISFIIVNELKLTSGAANATLAYYAAEAGIEKGLYAVKIYRNDPAMYLENDAQPDQSAVHIIRDYADDTFVNGTEYDNDQTSSKISKVEGEEIKEDKYLQMDYYDIDSPLVPDYTVESINIKNEGDNPSSWVEVFWTAWNNQGELVTSTTAKKVIGPTDLQSGWPITLNIFSPEEPVGYRLRIKALFGDLSSVTVKAYKPGEEQLGDEDLPSQLVIKSVGERGRFKQSLTATVPWKLPLFGLYDYVLFSEESLIKTVILSREIYSSGAIQVESNLSSSCVGCPAKPYNTCLDWLAVCCTEFASCNVSTSIPNMCSISDIATEKNWVLPIPDYVPADEDYYFSIRAKYSGSGDKMRIILGETCKEIPYQDTTDWITCTISEADFSTMRNNNIKFEQIGTGTIDIDWYQLSTYKIFDDCSSVFSCTVPTPDCGNCVCEVGEICADDSMDCVDDGSVCKEPSCTNGCSMDNVPDNTADPDCFGDICCSGACKTPDCSVDGDCPDTDSDSCTVEACQDGDTCDALCYISQTITTCYDDPYGCCPLGCTPITDPDCVGPPDKEYLRYIARDESDNDLSSLYYSGKSMRPISTWQSQRDSAPTNDLRRVWAADQNNIWAVGEGDTILYSDNGGTSWSYQTSGTAGIILRGIDGVNSSNIWAVGYNGTILKYDGSAWSSQTSGTSENLFGVWAADQNNIWAVGANGTILYSNNGGTSWNLQTGGTAGIALGDIWGINTSNIWAIGQSGTILKYNGSAWSPQTSNTTSILYGIDGTDDASDIWVVGPGSLIIYSNDGGNSWDATSQNTGSITVTLYDVVVYDEYGAVRAMAVGLSGEAFYYNGSPEWLEQKTGTKALFGVYAIDQNNIWAVGLDEAIRYANAPGAHIYIDNSTDQYWYSRLYPTLDPPSGSYTVDLDVIRNTGANNKHVYVTMQIGYCVDGCDAPGDFVQIGTDSSEVDIKGTSATYYAGISLGSGDITCTNCRLWFRLWTSSAGENIDLLVSGREASFSNQLYRNSFIEIPGP